MVLLPSSFVVVMPLYILCVIHLISINLILLTEKSLLWCDTAHTRHDTSIKCINFIQEPPFLQQ